MKLKFSAFLTGLLFILVNMSYAQGIAITGTVLDDLGDGLPGASVSVVGENIGTVTNMDGKFSISVPGAKSVLEISFLGYQNQQVTVGAQKNIVVKMKEDSKLIDEVVIVGFGTQKKINATGSVKTIGNEVLEARPLSNAVQGLQGTIAGLNITNDAGGALGQEMSINIRGVGTVGDGSSGSPLVLIDGMEGDLSSINPNDIANISVLKDASSAAIYGSRAPFGVILVTTKQGDKGLVLNYKGSVRISQPIAVPNPVDSWTYAIMTNDAFINAGGSAQFGATQLNQMLQYQRGELEYGIAQVSGQNDWMYGQRSWGNTNWYDVYLKNHTTSQEHNLTLTGGGEKVTYYFAANYLDQSGLFNYADERYQRLVINGKVNATLTNFLRMTWNSRLVSTENKKPTALNSLFFHNLGRRYPMMPVYMPNGEYNKESLIPAIQDGGDNIAKNQVLYNQLSFIAEPIKDWKINVEINSRLENPRGTTQYKQLYYSLPDGTQEAQAVFEGIANKFEARSNGTFNIVPAAGTSVYEKYSGHVNYLNTNVYSDYGKTIGKNFFKVMIGMQSERYSTETNRMAANDILLDDRPFISSTASQTLLSEKRGKWTSLGFFGRANYSFAERYLAEVNLRYDGASRFPTDKRWALFPSFSLGWNIAEEAFWQPLANIGFEFLKLRGSYGTLGNQNTQSFYQYYQQMNTESGSLVLGDSQASVLPVYSPYTSNLTWEKVENIGIGVDWGFFNNRLSGLFELYQRKTKNMLGPSVPLASIFGGTAPRTNTAELRTRGWELELTWRDRINKNFNYSITATLSDYESVVTKYDSPDGNLDNWYSGKKVGEMWGYQVIGIAQSDEEMEQHLANHSQAQIGTNWGGGDLMYRDINNDGSVDSGSNTIDNHGDLVIIGNSTPRFAYSFTLAAQYKFIDIRAFFQGIGKRDLFFKGSATFFGIAAPWQRSFYSDHLDYFRYAGSELGANMDNPYYGRIRTDQNNIQVSDRFVQNGSYLRLKNLQIGFNLPNNTRLSKVIKNGRIYVSGENLFTLTKLRIYDPEAVGSPNDDYGAGKTYPMYRVWSVGLEVTF